jgi:hypothetical protein
VKPGRSLCPRLVYFVLIWCKLNGTGSTRGNKNLNAYSPSIRDHKYRTSITILKEKIVIRLLDYINTLIVEDFSTPLSVMDRSSR